MMKVESSGSDLASANPRTARGATRSLRRLLLASVSAGALLVLGLVAGFGLVVLKKSLAGGQDIRIRNAAALSKQLVERVLAERTRQIDLIATAPTVIAAAVRGGDVSRAKGLPRESIETLEERFKVTRSQQVDPLALQYLVDLLPKLDIAEVMVTDQYGYNAVTTSPSADFVQSDEAWWQRAWADGFTTAQATEDKATNQTVVELAHVVRDRTQRTGVVKVKFGLTTVDSVLAQGSASDRALRVELTDSTGHVIASS